jgi:hypothetical protein
MVEEEAALRRRDNRGEGLPSFRRKMVPLAQDRSVFSSLYMCSSLLVVARMSHDALSPFSKERPNPP